MRKNLFLLLLIIIFMVSCSNNIENSKSSSDQDTSGTEAAVEREKSDFSMETKDNTDEQDADESGTADMDDTAVKNIPAQSDRKVIYTADLQVEVKNYQKTLNELQRAVADRDGYIISSHMNKDTEDGTVTGQLTVRIPQDSFREFIQLVEDSSSKVLGNAVSGEDVTEEYVDLKSRLKSKEVVEERLVSFMKQAEKTEDLLSISDDLANVQESIEEIKGQLKYLENKTDLATITIDIYEYNVKLSGLSDKDLNTWEKTKQQFMKSINFLLSVLSGLFIFLAGNLPIIILLVIVVWLSFIIVRKPKRK